MKSSASIFAMLHHRERAILVAFIVLIFWRLTIAPLPSSFWIDETSTYWVTADPSRSPLELLEADQPPHMALYVTLLWLWTFLAGHSEVALRLPSVLAHGLTCYLLYRTVRLQSLAPANTNLYAVLIYTSISAVAFASCDARAYAMGLVFVVWSLFERTRWIQSGQTTAFNMLRHGIAVGLALHFCYFFGVLVIADSLLVLYTLVWLRRPPSYKLLLSPLSTLLVSMPLIPFLMLVFSRASAHSAASLSPPTWRDLGAQWLPGRIIIALAFAGVASLFYRSRDSWLAAALPKRPLVAMAIFLSVTPSLILFALSIATRKQYFIDRYMLPQSLGLALLLTLAASAINAAGLRLAFASALALMALSGGGVRFWGQHGGEDWRSATTLVEQWHAAHPQAPIFAAAVFYESLHVPLPPTPIQQQFFRPYLSAYPLSFDPKYLPPSMTPENQGYVIPAIDNALRSRQVLLLLPTGSNFDHWLKAYLANRFSVRVLFGSPPVLLIEDLAK